MTDPTNWEAIGATGEVIGAIAVVLTLLFLAAQLRANTKAVNENSALTRAEMIREAERSIAAFAYSLAENSDLSSLWSRAMANDDLQPDEADRLFWLVRNFVGSAAASFYSYDTVGDDVSRDGNAKICARILSSSEQLWFAWLRMKNGALTDLKREEFITTVEMFAEELRREGDT